MGFAFPRRRFSSWLFIFIGIWLLALVGAAGRGAATATALPSGTFVRKVLAPALPESPFDLRFFSGAVKTNSRGEIITGLDDDPVKNIVGWDSSISRTSSRPAAGRRTPGRSRAANCPLDCESSAPPTATGSKGRRQRGVPSRSI